MFDQEYEVLLRNCFDSRKNHEASFACTIPSAICKITGRWYLLSALDSDKLGCPRVFKIHGFMKDCGIMGGLVI